MLVALLLLPWWVALVIGVIAMRWFAYYEFMVIGFVIDLMYGSPAIWADRYIHPPLFFLWLTFFIFIALQLLKKKVRFQ